MDEIFEKLEKDQNVNYLWGKLNVQGIDPNATNKKGVCLLYFCCYHNFSNLVSLLLTNSKINVNLADSWGETPLMIAARRGCAESVRILLNDGRTNTSLVTKKQFTFQETVFPAGLDAVHIAILSKNSNQNTIDLLKEDLRKKSQFPKINENELELIRKIGQGNQGEVWEGIYQNKNVAVKLINSQILNPYDEINLLFQLSSRCHNVTKAYGVCESFSVTKIPINSNIPYHLTHIPCIVMRRYEKSIRDLMPTIQFIAKENREIKGGLGSWAKVAKIGLDIADTLWEIHEEGVILRDLKPDNLLVDKNGRIVVSDVGISKQAQNLNGTLVSNSGGMIEGTPHFCPPEAFISGEFTRKFDIWSFGVTLANMLEGDTEFFQTNISEVIRTIAVERKIPNFDIFRGVGEETPPNELITLIKNCLSFDPEERPSSSQLSQDLKLILSNVPYSQTIL